MKADKVNSSLWHIPGQTQNLQYPTLLFLLVYGWLASSSVPPPAALECTRFASLVNEKRKVRVPINWMQHTQTEPRQLNQTVGTVFINRSIPSYYVSFVWSCNVALWDISLHLVEWGTCAVIRLYDRHTHSQLIHTGSVCQYCTSATIRRVSYKEVIEMLPK